MKNPEMQFERNLMLEVFDESIGGDADSLRKNIENHISSVENKQKFENVGIVDAINNKIKEEKNEFTVTTWENDNRELIFKYRFKYCNKQKEDDRFIKFYLDEKMNEPVLKLQRREDFLKNSFVTTINITDITKDKIDECLETAMKVNAYGSSISTRPRVHNNYQKMTQEEFLNHF